MLATVSSCALQGLDGVVVQVEVDATRGMPGLTVVGLTVVGLPDAAVRESRERVRSAIKNSNNAGCLAYLHRELPPGPPNVAPGNPTPAGPEMSDLIWAQYDKNSL
ncbi:MAG: magnesium chelatase domain-containing protein [Desulfosalsimonadaceae bacterium]